MLLRDVAHRTFDVDGAVREVREAEQDAEQGGLARTVRPEHCEELAGRHVELEVIEQDPVAVLHARVAEPDHTHGVPPSAASNACT